MVVDGRAQLRWLDRRPAVGSIDIYMNIAGEQGCEANETNRGNTASDLNKQGQTPIGLLTQTQQE